MKEQMKILLGYDGSECSEQMLADLNYAGLPAQADVLVMSVAEHWLAPPTSLGGVDVHFTEAPDEAAETLMMAQQAQALLRFQFPEWDVKTEAVWGMPASKLVEKADDWKPDLIIVGSHGRSAIGRFFLGSVSQKVVHEAHCSVRIARHARRIVVVTSQPTASLSERSNLRRNTSNAACTTSSGSAPVGPFRRASFLRRSCSEAKRRSARSRTSA